MMCNIFLFIYMRKIQNPVQIAEYKTVFIDIIINITDNVGVLLSLICFNNEVPYQNQFYVAKYRK